MISSAIPSSAALVAAPIRKEWDLKPVTGQPQNWIESPKYVAELPPGNWWSIEVAHKNGSACRSDSQVDLHRSNWANCCISTTRNPNHLRRSTLIVLGMSKSHLHTSIRCQTNVMKSKDRILDQITWIGNNFSHTHEAKESNWESCLKYQRLKLGWTYAV